MNGKHMEGKNINVLMTTDTASSIWKYSLELCKTLERYGVQVHLVALGGWPSPYQQAAAENLPNVTFYKSDFKLDWMKETWEDRDPSRKWLNSIYHSVNPDILHLNNYTHVEESWTASMITAFHSGVQTWLHAAKGNQEPEIWADYLKEVKQSLETLEPLEKPTTRIMKKYQNRRRSALTRQVV